MQMLCYIECRCFLCLYTYSGHGWASPNVIFYHCRVRSRSATTRRDRSRSTSLPRSFPSREPYTQSKPHPKKTFSSTEKNESMITDAYAYRLLLSNLPSKFLVLISPAILPRLTLEILFAKSRTHKHLSFTSRQI
jgi:hypothetical protein